MSVGCAIVASDTQPLHEAIKHNETGRLFDYFDHKALVSELTSLLNDSSERVRLGENARKFAKKNYDLNEVCLPTQIEWVNKLQTNNS
jgi:glycosyltransferase involved in cell wall biosynthesis